MLRTTVIRCPGRVGSSCGRPSRATRDPARQGAQDLAHARSAPRERQWDASILPRLRVWWYASKLLPPALRAGSFWSGLLVLHSAALRSRQRVLSRHSAVFYDGVRYSSLSGGRDAKRCPFGTVVSGLDAPGGSLSPSAGPTHTLRPSLR